MISVIIPTYKRLLSLDCTLQSLVRQSLDKFEIIIVDNEGNDDVENLVKNFATQCNVCIRYVRFTSGGNSGARNHGVLHSNGDILVFTDDDLTFDKDWLLAYKNSFSKYPDMIAAAGCVKPKWESYPPQWLLNYIDGRGMNGIYALMDLGRNFIINTDKFFFSCNMGIRKSVFEWTGFRPEIYGVQTLGNGESGLNKELIDKGCLIGYVPEAIAYHHIPVSRMTVRYIRNWAWHEGGAQMFAKWHNKNRNLVELLKEGIIICRRHWRNWIKSFITFGRNDPESIHILYDASLGWCKLKYLSWMFTDSRVKKILDIEDYRPR